jgi:gliding motility-associated lipoprotein GldH
MVLGAVFYSCQNNEFFSEYVKIPIEGWNKDKLAQFKVDITENSNVFNIYININHGNSYENSNLWLFINTYAPDGKYQRDTLNCILSEESGKWKGIKDGKNLKVKVLFKSSVTFANTGEYKFEIQQGMRSNNITDIQQIGLSFEKIPELKRD